MRAKTSPAGPVGCNLGKTAEIKELLNTRKQPTEIILIMGYKKATAYGWFRRFLIQQRALCGLS